MPSSELAAALPAVAPAQKRLVPWLVAVAFLLESLDTTILNTAAPTVADALGVAPLSMKAVLSSYTLSLAIFIPVSGWMADRFGTRRVFSSAIALFTLGSLLCGLAAEIHVLVACRILQGMGGALMVPVGRLTIVRTFERSELVRAMSFVAIPALIGPMLGPVVGGFIVSFFHWRMIFFVNLPIGMLGMLLVWRYLPEYAQRVAPLDVLGLLLFGSGTALLSYVLEVFGEHTLGTASILALLALSALLLTSYFLHARASSHALLQLGLFRIRTFRSAVAGSFLTRLGAGGLPFLLPLLYQVGLGYSPVQSGLLLMPQSVAALGMKMTMPVILNRLGYRRVLVSNTLLMGSAIALFATVGRETPVFAILLLSACFGFLASLQYTSMNTLAYADVSDSEASKASTIASTLQQMSLSFGVAAASLSAAIFIPDRMRSDPAQIVHGIHSALLALGALTAVSTLIFRELQPNDGASVSRHTSLHPH
ncbi:MAG TPA: DHA2 family efflux MFS transporter permease subunit [Polyangiaceae bacterium]|nr:DHA2 family efflux MFS transporter permease subunit [Polyangiaceae bacterium]